MHGEHDHGHQHDHHHGHPHHHGHGHGRGHVHAPAGFGTAFAVGTALNAGFVIVEATYGVFANSVALIADAAHNASDVLGLLLAWGAAVLSRRTPSQRRTYGWGRGSIYAALINAAVLLVAVGGIVMEAMHRFANPAPVTEWTVAAVAMAGVVVNGVTAWLFARGHEDLNIRATYLHMAADAAVSLGVVVAAALIAVTGAAWLDPAMSIVIAGVIVAGTWGVLRDAADLAMDAVPAHLSREDVEAYLRKLPGVTEVHDLHIWGLSTTETALTAHLVHDSPARAHDELLLRACRELGAQFRIRHVTLQVETEHTANACRLRPADVV